MIESEILQQAEELASLISRLMRAINTIDSEDPAIELPLAQIRACGMIMDAPRTITNLAKELCISASAATQLADRLEKAGLAERFAEQDDNRVKLLRLTDYGWKIIDARRRRRVERIARALNELTSDDRRLAIDLVRKLCNAGNTANVQQFGDSKLAVETSPD
jgi:DNA-binding MarR family transcriptional regulator